MHSNTNLKAFEAIFRDPRPWLFIGGFALFAVLFLIPAFTAPENPATTRLAFSGVTEKPLQWLDLCLSKDWGRRLSLRPRQAPIGDRPSIRLDNPVRHFIIDVTDDGNRRTLKAYSQNGEQFSVREQEALEGCLTGGAPALDNP